MTAEPLTVYGKRTGSLWDRRIGGRWELVEITDTGGTGMWVTLRRVDGGHELAVSVYNLGRNYVPVPEKAGPAEGRSAGDAFRSAAERVDAALDRMDSAPTAVSEPVNPNPNGCPHDHLHSVDCVSEPVEPSDVHDGDLLTGALYGNPFTEWVASRPDSGTVQFGESRWPISLSYAGEWLSYVTVSSRKPAPSPLLPWMYWQEEATREVVAVDPSACKDCIVGEPHTCRYLTPNPGWQRVAVIPWDLIEKAKRLLLGGYSADAIQAIFDAADVVTS